ncbi:MAG: flagellar export protein FliJ [Treponema sp.]|jgi:flagellar FliJ protein|nr:flagellar export protein FliJ [Treponema sp.]
MRRFDFKLEKILRLRKYEEEEAKIELGRALGSLAAAETQLRSLGEERFRAAQAQFSPSNGAAGIRQYMFYLLRLDNRKEELLKEAALAGQKVEEAREVFNEAFQNRRRLDKLKEKREREYKDAAEAEENKAIDDIAGNLRRKASLEEPGEEPGPVR